MIRLLSKKLCNKLVHRARCFEKQCFPVTKAEVHLLAFYGNVGAWLDQTPPVLGEGLGFRLLNA